MVRGKDVNMTIKWIGAILVVLGCGSVGFAMSAAHRREERNLRQLISALDFMQCELQYRLTPLPDLCRLTAAQCRGSLRTLFLTLARELEDQINPDVYHCMNAALTKVPDLTKQTAEAVTSLGRTLGRFDLDGQILGLENARNNCRSTLEKLSDNREIRLRSYQTLSLCAGAALAILFL